MKQTWRSKAKLRWDKQAAWIDGNGQFALLAPCRVLTVTLWKTLSEAERQKAIIDQYACGGRCSPRLHTIIDLSLGA